MTGANDAEGGVDTERIARRWGYGRRRPNPFKPSEFDIHLLLGELDRMRQRGAALQEQIDMMEAEIAAKDSEWAVAHLGAKVRLLNRVLDAARDLHRISGHNLPGWVACTGPRPCAWERLDMAFTAVAQAEHEST